MLVFSVPAQSLMPLSKASYRYLGFVHLFDATFFAKAPEARHKPLGDFQKSLEFVYKRSISRKQLIAAADKMLLDFHDISVLESISNRLDQINNAYLDVQKGDSYLLCYDPEQGTTLSLNGDPLITIPGSDFQEIYFSIWLSPRSPFKFQPIDI